MKLIEWNPHLILEQSLLKCIVFTLVRAVGVQSQFVDMDLPCCNAEAVQKNERYDKNGIRK